MQIAALEFPVFIGKILKATFDICADSLTTISNDGIQEFLFPDQLKSANVRSLHKSGVKTSTKKS